MGRGRIDTRPQNSKEVQGGMRGIHRDMRGNVIGGYAPDGRALGTKANMGGAAPGNLASQAGTPGLDRMTAMNPKMPAPGQASINASRGPAWKSAAQRTAKKAGQAGMMSAGIPANPPAPPVDKPMPTAMAKPKRKWWDGRTGI